LGSFYVVVSIYNNRTVCLTRGVTDDVTVVTSLSTISMRRSPNSDSQGIVFWAVSVCHATLFVLSSRHTS